MKILREGFTTGSCAAAAALASCLWQKEGKCPAQISLKVPEGRVFAPEILMHGPFLCGVIKDSGDDPDITNGAEIRAEVEIESEKGPVRFCAGEGVGTVTNPGLKVSPGEPAINPVPRRMIEEAVRSVFPQAGACVTVSIPGGEALARQTFNPRLGIEGGLSILGTSGIVRPMSDEALREALVTELDMRVAQGWKRLIYTFGNQGETALSRLYPGECILQISNEVGFMLDMARERGIEEILLGGHPGKLFKVAGGSMQTHSKYGDGRLEPLLAHLGLMGAPAALLEEVSRCTTTDAAIPLVMPEYAGVFNRLAAAAQRYCSLRVQKNVKIEVELIDWDGQILGSTRAWGERLAVSEP